MSSTPRYPIYPDPQWGDSPILANTATDGTGANVTLVYTAPTGGGFVRGLMVTPKGTNAGATLLRAWGNNGSSQGTASNNFFLNSVPIAAYTLSQLTATPLYQMPILVDGQGLALPAGYRIYVAVGTAISVALAVVVDAMKFDP